MFAEINISKKLMFPTTFKKSNQYLEYLEPCSCQYSSPCYRVFIKNCFFFNSLQPIPCIQKNNSSSQEILAYSHSYWLTIFVQPIAAQCWRWRGRKIQTILGKNTISNEHPEYRIDFDRHRYTEDGTNDEIDRSIRYKQINRYRL